MSKKFLRKALSVLCVLALMVSMPGSAFASALDSAETVESKDHSTLEPSSAAGVDLSLETELEQAERVWNHFYDPNETEKVFDDPQNAAKMFIPEGAICTQVYLSGAVLYIDYKFNGIRYIIQYNEDGSVGKSARVIDGDDCYSVDSCENAIHHFNVMDFVQTYEISEEEANERMEQMRREKRSGCYSLDGDLPRSTGKLVVPLSYRDDPNTAPYEAKIVSSGSTRIDAFSGTSYNVYQPYRIYETMSYHTEVSRRIFSYQAKKYLRDIADTFTVHLDTLKGWLRAAKVLYDSADILLEPCSVLSEAEYTFLGGKECGIYDPTENNRYVETYSSWSTGKITLNWGYNSSTGYKDPSWGHSTRCESLMTPNSTILEEGRSAYNSSISMYGVWKWGPGNGFGY